ncbi:MFS transporter [Streptomyces nigra]
MTTTEARGGSAAVGDAARGVTGPFYVYAVLANSLFQRGVFVLYLQQRGFSAGQVAVLQTLIYLVSGLAELPTGVIADRIGRRASIVIGQVLIAVCLLGQAASSQYWVFVALFIGHGVGMACVSGSDTALLYDLLVRRGATAGYVRIRSRFTMLGTVTSGVAIVLGGQLQRLSWAIVYVGSAACLVLAVLVLMARVPEIRGADAVDEQGGTGKAHVDTTAWRALLRVATPALVTLAVVSGLMHATLTPYIIFTQQVLSDQGAGTALVSVVIAGDSSQADSFPCCPIARTGVSGIGSSSRCPFWRSPRPSASAASAWCGSPSPRSSSWSGFPRSPRCSSTTSSTRRCRHATGQACCR